MKALVAAHKERYGRLDVLVNNAGVGIGGALAETETKKLDMQLDVNLRSYVIAMREAMPMLKEAGGEHGKALIVNTASIAGQGRAGLARRLLGDEGRRDRAQPGDADGGREGRHPGDGALPRRSSTRR